jgi:hypothetical protein
MTARMITATERALLKWTRLYLVERMGPAVGRVSRIIFEIEGMENEK